LEGYLHPDRRESILHTRAWIQQEVRLARDAIIYWGGHQISWGRLATVSAFLVRHYPILYERFGLVSSTRLYNAEHMYNGQHLQVNDETTFWHLLAFARRLEVMNGTKFTVFSRPFPRPPVLVIKTANSHLFCLITFSESANQIYTEVATKGLISQMNPLVCHSCLMRAVYRNAECPLGSLIWSDNMVSHRF
jgi:hypothetical protein